MEKIYKSVFHSLAISLLLSFLVINLPGCKKTTTTTTATGSLLTSDGACRQSNVHGNYFAGTVVANDTTYVQISVNVTKPGSYRIATNKSNGVMFQAAGSFADTGLNLVRLMSSGSFTNVGATTFDLGFDSTSCQFTVTVQDSAGVGMADNSWRFTAGGHTYSGPGVGTYYAEPYFMADGFEFVGSMQGYSDTSLTIDFGWYAGIYSSCAHATTLGNTSFHFVSSRFASGSQIRLDANQQTSGAALFIRQQTWSTGLWTFSGSVLDAGNHVVQVTNGVFKSTHYNYDASNQ